MPGDIEDVALSSGEEDLASEEDEDMEMMEAELEAMTIGFLFFHSYHPKFMDLCLEFADLEEFLIDGDALLRQTLAKEGIGSDLVCLVTLHITSLVERSLFNFTDRAMAWRGVKQ